MANLNKPYSMINNQKNLPSFHFFSFKENNNTNITKFFADSYNCDGCLNILSPSAISLLKLTPHGKEMILPTNSPLIKLPILPRNNTSPIGITVKSAIFHGLTFFFRHHNTPPIIAPNNPP